MIVSVINVLRMTLTANVWFYETFLIDLDWILFGKFK